jgi:hypothetical protein
VSFALKVVMQNDGDVMDVILLYLSYSFSWCTVYCDIDKENNHTPDERWSYFWALLQVFSYV